MTTLKTKSRVVKSELPCPHCTSSDAYTLYDDGHGYCYSCEHYDHKTDNVDEPADERPRRRRRDKEEDYTTQIIPHRSLTKETLKRYGIVTKVGDDGEPIETAFKYNKGLWQIRDWNEKRFRSAGSNTSQPGLLGHEAFSAGSSDSVTICSGGYDAPSVFQMVGRPAVSVKSDSTAVKDCEAFREYLNSFDKIYLCFDNDKHHDELVKKIARLFDFNKVYHVKMTKYKDPNEYLENGEVDEFKRLWWRSRRFLPEGVISSFEDVKRVLSEEKAQPIATYPFETLQYKTYGIWPDDIVLFKALEGIGKTEIFRAIEYHLMQTTDYNIGIIHLEENERRTIQGIASYHLRQPVHLPDSTVANNDIFKAYQEAVKRDERVYIHSHFPSDDPNDVLDLIRFLVTVCGCRVILLDHLTLLVTGMEEKDERKRLDYLSTKLAKMVQELGFALLFISHVNDEGQTRGSRNISKIAKTVIHLSRDLTNPDPVVSNTTFMMLEKNRIGAHTGPAGRLWFDIDTFCLEEVPFEPDIPEDGGD